MSLPPAPRDVEEAIAWEIDQIDHPTRQDWNPPSFDWLGACLSVTRQAAGTPKVYDDATQAWNNAVHRHEWDDEPPRGAIVFWTGGSHGHGHVVRSLGEGVCLSNDLVRRGRIDIVEIADLNRFWGLPRAGWTNDINGYLALPLDQEEALSLPHAPLEEDMSAADVQELKEHIDAIFAGAVGPGQVTFAGTVAATLNDVQATFNAVRAATKRPCTIVGVADQPERLLLANGAVLVIPQDRIRVDLQAAELADSAVLVSADTYALLRSAVEHDR
jgi:hypothetical protein